MSTQIDSLSIKIESTSRDATSAIDGLIASLEKLKKAGNFSSIEKSLKKITDAANGGLKKLPTTFSKASKSAGSYSHSVKDAAANTHNLGEALNNAASGLASFIGNAVGIHTVGQALSGALAAGREWEGISARFGEGFAEQADEAYAHVMKLQDALYVNDQMFMQYASNFATLGRGMGVPTRAIKDMSLGLTELAYDIYAKNNDFYTIEESLDAVRSAYLGEIEPIRKAGISITEATLKEAAANYGLTMSVENMTEAQKMQLRYKVMVDQAYASSTVGTYIKEINTVEGSSRALGQQLKGLAQTIGGLLMPVVAAVMPYIQAFVSLLTMAIQAVATFFGISIKAPTWGSGMDSLADSAGAATDSVDAATGALGSAAKAAKKLKDYTMGFDELNVIKPQQDTSGGGSGAAGGSVGGDLGLELDSLWTDAMIESANAKADAVTQNIIKALQPLKDAVAKIDFQPFIASVKNLWEALKPFGSAVGSGLYWFLINVLVPLAGFTIENVIPAFLNTLADSLNWLTPRLEAFGEAVANADYSPIVSAFERIKEAISFDSGSTSNTVVTEITEIEKIKISDAVATAIESIASALDMVAATLEWLLPRLKAFGDWFSENKEHILTVAGYVLTFFLAFKGVEAVADVATDLKLFGTGLKNVKNFVGKALTKLNALKVIFSANGGGLGGTVKVATTLFSSFFGLLKSAIATVFSPVGAIVLAVAAAAMVLYQNWDKVVAVVKTFIEKLKLKEKFDGIMKALAPMMEKLAGLKDLFGLIGTVVLVAVQPAIAVVVGVFNGLISMIEPLIVALGGVIDILAGVGEFLVGVFTLDGEKAIEGAKKIISGVGDVFSGLWEACANGVIGFFDGVIGWFKSLWDELVGHSIVPDTINAIVDWFLSLPGKIFNGLSAFVQNVINYFKNMWTGVTNTWKGIAEWFGKLFKTAWTNIQNAWASVKTWFAGIWSSIKTTFSTVGTWFKSIFATAWTNIKNAWASVKSWFSSLWSGIKSVFSTVGTWFKTMFTTAWSNVKNAWSNAKTWFSNIWTGIKNVFSSVNTWFKSKFQSAWTNIKNVFSGWASFFSGLWNRIKNTFSGLGTSLGNAIGGAVKTAINRVLGWIESTINSAIGKINGAIKVINKLPGVNVSSVGKISIPRMATGGFVGEGQLFIARERGPEMVGSMNGSTAVANNEQIVEGISQGVYAAVVAAMSQSSGGDKPVSVNVFLDGKQITTAVEKRQRERGRDIMTGGVTFGY